MLEMAGLTGGFPMPIFIANLMACFFIGVISALAIEDGGGPWDHLGFMRVRRGWRFGAGVMPSSVFAARRR
jgi:fluoride ion exporter CrcB/FEX